jgi:SAM-dependent methyltransferase
VQTAEKDFSTDWDKYHRAPFPASHITRRLTARKVIGLLSGLFGGKPVEIAEFGGGNSFIADRILAHFLVQRYVVWDDNARALGQLRARFSDDPIVETQLGDILDLEDGPEFDFVFSIGLIEHFDPEGTRRALENHFRLCRAGGHVLVSFPTPTLLYRLIRGLAELTGSWKFPDERPLRFDEVLDVASKYGALKHRSILWGIGLTQGYGLFQKENKNL